MAYCGGSGKGDLVVDPITTGAVVAGAWVGKKLLGPTLDAIAADFRKLYAAGRDRIIGRAAAKVDDLDDGRRSNLRVTRDVLWNGAFSESEVCVEYYAGLLAASRSSDGLDDTAVPFVDAVKSLASSQLRLHYGIYRSLERILEETHADGGSFDVFGIQGRVDVFVVVSLESALDLQVLQHSGLISEFETNRRTITREGREEALSFCRARPTLFGMTLYAAAHNQLEWWQAFGLRRFGEFGGVEPPELYGRTLEELLGRTA